MSVHEKIRLCEIALAVCSLLTAYAQYRSWRHSKMSGGQKLTVSAWLVTTAALISEQPLLLLAGMYMRAAADLAHAGARRAARREGMKANQK